MTIPSEKYGNYTFVTAASAVIGKVLAKELAARGLDLVLVMRKFDKLEALASTPKQQTGIEVKGLSLNLSQDDAVHRLVQETAALQEAKPSVTRAASEIRMRFGRLDVLITNAAGAARHGETVPEANSALPAKLFDTTRSWELVGHPSDAGPA